MTRPIFVEAGAASAVLAISEQAGIPLAPTQADLTPFQRMVLTQEIERQHQESQTGQGTSLPGGNSFGNVNSQRQPLGGGRRETVTYTNTHADE